MEGNGEKESLVGFGKAVSITKSVNDAGEIKRVRTVAVKSKLVEESESFVNISVNSTKLVNSSGPVSSVIDQVPTNFKFLCFSALLLLLLLRS